MKTITAWFVAAVAVAASAAAAAAPVATLVDEAATRIEPPWREVYLPKQTLPKTRFVPARVDGRAAIWVDVAGSYGNLVHELQPARSLQRLRWAWRLETPNPRADLTRKDADDGPIRVCVSFAMPIERVPFLERQLLRIARSRTGEELPAATLCYAWDSRLPSGTLLRNIYTPRVRLIVLRGGGDALATWFAEERDLAADFRRAFGDESPEMPVASALVIAGDGDNTGAGSRAAIADLKIDLRTAP
jgi:hypothetical protein